MRSVSSSPARPRSPIELTVEGLRTLVIEDSEPGHVLPSEAELAERFDVSRLTVREALKHLAGQGLVDVSRGRRPVVAQQTSGVLSDYFHVSLRRDPRGLLELNEIRRSLEVLSAASAAQNATPAAIQAMSSAIDRMRECAESSGDNPGDATLEAYHRADLDFHSALALASGNRMLALLLDSLGDCLHESFEASAQGHFARGGTMIDVVDAHSLILTAITAADAKAAARAMTAHLEDAQRDLRAAMRQGHPGRNVVER